MSVALISLMSIVEVFGDSQLKFYARTGKTPYLLGGLVGYAGIVYFLIRILRKANAMYVNGMWDGISAIIETGLLYILVGERLNTPGQYAGIGFVSLGLFMLARGGIAY